MSLLLEFVLVLLDVLECFLLSGHTPLKFDFFFHRTTRLAFDIGYSFSIVSFCILCLLSMITKISGIFWSVHSKIQCAYCVLFLLMLFANVISL